MKKFPHPQFIISLLSWKQHRNFDDCARLILFQSLEKVKNLTFSLKRHSACFTRSFIAILSFNFSWRWAWFKESNDINTHEQPQWVHSEHFAWPVIIMQEERTAEQWSQAMREVKLKVAMILWGEDNCAAYEKAWQWESYLSLYSHLYRHELASKREEIVLQSDCNQLVF
jgi:hypothetical protein